MVLAFDPCKRKLMPLTDRELALVNLTRAGRNLPPVVIVCSKERDDYEQG